MILLRLMRADWLKTRRTPVRWAVIAMPAGYALLILWYFSRFRVTPELPLRIYSAFFEGWTVFLPLAVGLLTGLLSLQEEQAGRFGALLGSTASRSVLYAAKLLLLIVITAGSVLISLAILVPGMQAGLGIEATQAGMFWAGAWLAVAGALPQLALHLWLPQPRLRTGRQRRRRRRWPAHGGDHRGDGRRRSGLAGGSLGVARTAGVAPAGSRRSDRRAFARLPDVRRPGRSRHGMVLPLGGART